MDFYRLDFKIILDRLRQISPFRPQLTRLTLTHDDEVARLALHSQQKARKHGRFL
jgi:hypothetical protein